MGKKYCIANMEERILSFLLDENGHALEIRCDEAKEAGKEAEAPELGDIYVGRVQSVVKNLRAAFVEIAPGAVCYLPLEDAEPAGGGSLSGEEAAAPIYTKKGASLKIQQGDELVVQIAREAIKSKAPAVTTRLSLSGKYGILDMAHPGIGVSRKLSDEQRERLRRLGRRFLTAGGKGENTEEQDGPDQKETSGETGTIGVVLRTNAANAEDEVILAELEQLYGKLRRIAGTARYRTCYSCLYHSPAPWLKRLVSLSPEETEAICIEDELLYRQAEDFIRENIPELQEKLFRYQDALLPMEKLFSLKRELRNALSQRVWLDSGAYLVIQPTEALTVIDVNTGKCAAGRQKEEMIRRVNLEAARETARQLRLRNLSGIILVDFINMGQEESRQQVMETLRRLLFLDPVQAHVVDITKLGLVEITRKKAEKPLHEAFWGAGASEKLADCTETAGSAEEILT